MQLEQAPLMASPSAQAPPPASGARIVRVARFQTLFAIVGLYALGCLSYLAASTSSTLSTTSSGGGSYALQMFPVVGNDAPREFGQEMRVAASGASAGGRSAPRLRCIGWKQTDNCDPDAPVVANRNRTCDQFVRGGVPGYCLMEDEDSGEQLRVMRTTCLSVRPDVVFSCRHAGEFADLRFAVDSLALDLEARATASSGANASAVDVNDSPADGIVMVVYPKLLVSAMASLRVLRKSLNCSLPVELWYSAAEMRTANVSVSALEGLARNGSAARELLTLRALDGEPRQVSGFNAKVWAVSHSRFDRVLFLDADNVPVRDPTYLFSTREFREFGALFWPDFWHPDNTIFNVNEGSLLWQLLGMRFVDMFEQESGQLLVDRRVAGASGALEMLQLLAFHEPSLLARLKLAHGDKDLFRLAWLRTKTPFFMVPHPPGTAGTVRDGKFCGMTMVQADPAGDVLFLHRNAKKLTGGRGPQAQPDELVWTHLQRFQYLGLEADARRVSPPSKVAVEPLTPPPTRASGARVRSGKLEMGYEAMKRAYQVEIYNGAPQFASSQWCYGQQGLLSARYKTVPWEMTAFPDVERQLLQFARDAAAELPPQRKVPLMLAPIKLKIGGIAGH